MKNLFTPRTQSGERLRMSLSDKDRLKIPFRGVWESEITDLETGKRYLAKGAPCGLGCHCDAIVTEIACEASA